MNWSWNQRLTETWFRESPGWYCPEWVWHYDGSEWVGNSVHRIWQWEQDTWRLQRVNLAAHDGKFFEEWNTDFDDTEINGYVNLTSNGYVWGFNDNLPGQFRAKMEPKSKMQPWDLSLGFVKTIWFYVTFFTDPVDFLFTYLTDTGVDIYQGVQHWYDDMTHYHRWEDADQSQWYGVEIPDDAGGDVWPGISFYTYQDSEIPTGDYIRVESVRLEFNVYDRASG